MSIPWNVLINIIATKQFPIDIYRTLNLINIKYIVDAQFNYLLLNHYDKLHTDPTLQFWISLLLTYKSINSQELLEDKLYKNLRKLKNNKSIDLLFFNDSKSNNRIEIFHQNKTDLLNQSDLFELLYFIFDQFQVSFINFFESIDFINLNKAIIFIVQNTTLFIQIIQSHQSIIQNIITDIKNNLPIIDLSTKVIPTQYNYPISVRDSLTNILFIIKYDNFKGSCLYYSPENTSSIKSGTVVCNYAKAVDEWKDDSYTEVANRMNLHDSYAVLKSEQVILLPKTYDYDLHSSTKDGLISSNLGLFANTYLGGAVPLPTPSVNYKQKGNNVRIVVGRKNNNVTFKTTKVIQPGDEILVSYGAGFANLLKKRMGGAMPLPTPFINNNIIEEDEKEEEKEEEDLGPKAIQRQWLREGLTKLEPFNQEETQDVFDLLDTWNRGQNLTYVMNYDTALMLASYAHVSRPYPRSELYRGMSFDELTDEQFQLSVGDDYIHIDLPDQLVVSWSHSTENAESYAKGKVYGIVLVGFFDNTDIVFDTTDAKFDELEEEDAQWKYNPENEVIIVAGKYKAKIYKLYFKEAHYEEGYYDSLDSFKEINNNNNENTQVCLQTLHYWDNLLFHKYSSDQLEFQTPTAMFLIQPVVRFCTDTDIKQYAVDLVDRLEQFYLEQHNNDLIQYSQQINFPSELTNLSLFLLIISTSTTNELAPEITQRARPIRENIALKLKTFSTDTLFGVLDLHQHLDNIENINLNVKQIRIMIDILVYSWLLSTVLNVELLECKDCSWKYSDVLLVSRKLIPKFKSNISDRNLMTNYAYLVTHIVLTESHYGMEIDYEQKSEQKFTIEINWMYNNLYRLIDLKLWEAVAECIFAFQILYSFSLPNNKQKLSDTAKQNLIQNRKENSNEWKNISKTDIDSKEHMAICGILALAPY